MTWTTELRSFITASPLCQHSAVVNATNIRAAHSREFSSKKWHLICKFQSISFLAVNLFHLNGNKVK